MNVRLKKCKPPNLFDDKVNTLQSKQACHRRLPGPPALSNPFRNILHAQTARISSEDAPVSRELVHAPEERALRLQVFDDGLNYQLSRLAVGGLSTQSQRSPVRRLRRQLLV